MKNQTESIYKRADRFASLTKQLIIKGNISRAKKCFAEANRLFENGTHETKTAITNVFVCSVYIFMDLNNCNVKNLFPPQLKNDYLKQINASGI